MNWNFAPFNGLYYIAWGIAIAITLGIYFIFRNKSEKTKTVFMVSFCSFIVALFFVYKCFLSVDKQYLTTYDVPLERFNWFNELPFQLCNINMFIIAIAVITKKRGLLGFAFFLAPLGATMALLNPERGFNGYSILMPRMWGFYGTHLLIVVAGISVATLGFYRPKFKDFPTIFITFFGVAIFAHIINLVFVKTGICKEANYFFTMNPSSVGILKMFRSWIDLPFLYLLPAIAILGVYMGVVTLPFHVVAKVNKNTEQQEAEEIKDENKETINV